MLWINQVKSENEEVLWKSLISEEGIQKLKARQKKYYVILGLDFLIYFFIILFFRIFSITSFELLLLFFITLLIGGIFFIPSLLLLIRLKELDNTEYFVTNENIYLVKSYSHEMYALYCKLSLDVIKQAIITPIHYQGIQLAHFDFYSDYIQKNTKNFFFFVDNLRDEKVTDEEIESKKTTYEDTEQETQKKKKKKLIEPAKGWPNTQDQTKLRFHYIKDHQKLKETIFQLDLKQN